MFLGVQSKFVPSVADLAQTVSDRSVELVREAQEHRRLNRSRSEWETSIGEMETSIDQSVSFYPIQNMCLKHLRLGLLPWTGRHRQDRKSILTYR